MKRYILIALALVSMSVSAQSKFGYVSYSSILKAMPEYSIVSAQLDELQAKYEAEITRSDREFNIKYAEFIDEHIFSFWQEIGIPVKKHIQHFSFSELFPVDE